MITLIMLVLGAIVAALFATQNTAQGLVTLANYRFQVPMYLIVLVSVLIGLVVSGILSSISSLFASFEMLGKDSKIKESKKTVADLTKKVHQLELENIQLKTELDKMPDEKSI